MDGAIKALVHAGRNGYLWLLERSANKINYVHAEPFVRQNVFTKLDPESGRPTYDPRTDSWHRQTGRVLPFGLGWERLATSRV